MVKVSVNDIAEGLDLFTRGIFLYENVNLSVQEIREIRDKFDYRKHSKELFVMAYDIQQVIELLKELSDLFVVSLDDGQLLNVATKIYNNQWMNPPILSEKSNPLEKLAKLQKVILAVNNCNSIDKVMYELAQGIRKDDIFDVRNDAMIYILTNVYMYLYSGEILVFSSNCSSRNEAIEEMSGFCNANKQW